MTLRDALHAGIVHLGEWVDAAQSGVDPSDDEQVPPPAPGSATATIDRIAAQIRDLHTSIRTRIQIVTVTDATITALRSLGVDVEPWMTPHLTAAIGHALADHAEDGASS